MAAPLDLDQLRTFLAVVDTGSFTRAAEEVFKTQSAVSMQIRRLEERLGKPLFERSGRAVRLSEEGARLLGYARRILSLSQEVLVAFDEEQLAGQVEIGLPDDYAERFLPEILARFSRTHPRIELQIACEPSENLIQHIERGRLDVALVSDMPESPASEVVRREPLHFVASAAHEVHLQSVLPLALGRPSCAWRSMGCEALESVGRRYHVLFTSWSAQIVASAVLAGLAVGVLPECALRPGMRVLGEREGFPHLEPTVINVVRARKGERPAVSALVEHIRESLQNLVPADVQPKPSHIRETRVIRSQRLRPGMTVAGW